MSTLSERFPMAGNLTRVIEAARHGVDGKGNLIREAWDNLAPLPGGKLLFSELMGRTAAYTGSIGARVEELRDGYGETSMRDRPKIRNHLRCVHAIALANLVEMTGNVAVGYSMPNDARFIVAGLGMDYLKKARGLIRGYCSCPKVTSNQRQEYLVLVTLKDESGDEVVRGTLRTLVGPKKSR